MALAGGAAGGSEHPCLMVSPTSLTPPAQGRQSPANRSLLLASPSRAPFLLTSPELGWEGRGCGEGRYSLADCFPADRLNLLTPSPPGKHLLGCGKGSALTHGALCKAPGGRAGACMSVGVLRCTCHALAQGYPVSCLQATSSPRGVNPHTQPHSLGSVSHIALLLLPLESLGSPSFLLLLLLAFTPRAGQHNMRQVAKGACGDPVLCLGWGM